MAAIWCNLPVYTSYSQYLLNRIIFAIFFVLNLVLWAEQSSAAIPFGTLVALLALWFGISVPLVCVGAYFGFRKPVSYELFQYTGWLSKFRVISFGTTNKWAFCRWNIHCMYIFSPIYCDQEQFRKMQHWFESGRKRELAWEHEHEARVFNFHAILSFSQTSTTVSIYNFIATRKKCFLFRLLNSLLKTIKKINLLI